MSGSTNKSFSAAVNGTVAAVEVSLRDVVSSWLEQLYGRIPCSSGLVDIDVDDEGNVVGIWDFGTEEYPFMQTGKIDVTRKELAVMQIATHLMAVLDMPDKDRDFVPAYVQTFGMEEEANGAMEGGVEEDGMARDSGEGMLRSESNGED